MKSAGKSMQELSESDDLKTFFDRRLIKALGHPVREHVLAVLNERTARAREIGDELDADVSSFYHHIETLEKLGCIERVETRRRRGASEHFFRARRTVFFDDTAWERFPTSVRADLRASFIRLLLDEVVAAIDAGTIGGRDDEHLSWIPGRFDEEGWQEATDLMNRTLERLIAIRGESRNRLIRDGEPGIAAPLGLLAFKTTGGENPTTEARSHALGRKPHRASAL